jgi:hypothetical protein
MKFLRHYAKIDASIFSATPAAFRVCGNHAIFDRGEVVRNSPVGYFPANPGSVKKLTRKPLEGSGGAQGWAYRNGRRRGAVARLIALTGNGTG